MSDNLEYKIGISLIPGIGCVNARKLIAYTGGVEHVFKQKQNTLLKIPGIGKYLANKIANQNVLDTAKKEIEFINKNNIKPVFYYDSEYPERLKHCEDAPLMLFMKGDINFNQNKVISIVGTRHATKYGKDICNKLVDDLANAGHKVIIVSGLAYGIDICAHKAALKNNLETVAVLGHGLDRIYPISHKNISDKIEKHGVIVSEFLSNSKFDRKNFLQRNRIIAGLSDATIIVESADKGGSLVTGEIANSYNRDVFAFPGKTTDKYSMGCNRLIKINKAMLIESYKDIEYMLSWNIEKSNIPIQKKLFVELSDEEEIIKKILEKEGKQAIDIISLKSKFSVSKVSSLLLNMEFAGIIKSLPGKIYSLS